MKTPIAIIAEGGMATFIEWGDAVGFMQQCRAEKAVWSLIDTRFPLGQP